MATGKTNVSGGISPSATITITYTGNHTDNIVMLADGNLYRLLTLTTSGILTPSKPIRNAKLWYCNGGTGGGGGDTFNTSVGTVPAARRGGDGGGFGYSSLFTFDQPISVIIGAGSSGSGGYGTPSAGGSTSVSAANDSSLPTNFEIIATHAGSGGGTGNNNYSNPGSGNGGVSTRPFFDAYFEPHCAGGGGGGFYDVYGSTNQKGTGGAGGTDGSAGSKFIMTGTAQGGIGGSKGGGAGGTPSYQNSAANNGANAIFYGGGGGGSATYENEDTQSSYGADYRSGSGGNGYQGVCYILIRI